tara:strand:+ start:813 stop:1250 length:438 start_codon:yes stop_codon:yes gene_type:complete
MSNSNFPEGNDPGLNNPINPSVVQDPIDSSKRVLVRNTVTGFEQGIAAVIGFFTAGPIGAVAAWGTIRGVQGKWTPWFLIGIPISLIINLINFLIFTIIAALIVAVSEDYSSKINNPRMYLMAVSNINLDIDKVNQNQTYFLKNG